MNVANVAGLKVFFASPEARELVADVVALELLAKELAERVKPLQSKALAKAGVVYGPYPGERPMDPVAAARVGKPIEDMSYLYLCFNDEAARKVDAEYSSLLLAAGPWPLVSPDEVRGGYCPSLVANHKLLKSRRALAERVMEAMDPNLKGRYIEPDMVDAIVRLSLGAAMGSR